MLMFIVLLLASCTCLIPLGQVQKFRIVEVGGTGPLVQWYCGGGTSIPACAPAGWHAYACTQPPARPLSPAGQPLAAVAGAGRPQPALEVLNLHLNDTMSGAGQPLAAVAGAGRPQPALWHAGRQAAQPEQLLQPQVSGWPLVLAGCLGRA